MAEPLAQVPTPSIPTGRIGAQEALNIQEPFLKRKSELGGMLAGAEADIATGKQAQAETLAAGRAAAGERRAGAERMAAERLETRMQQEPLPAFVPTKDTTQDIAALFSLIGVIGMVVGGGGRKNSLSAQAAMNGMLEGWQKGRSDLYARERNEFDKNFRAMVQKHNEFRKEMEDAVKLARTDYDAGMQAAELAAAKAGSDIVKAQLRKGELLNAYKVVTESQTGVTKALEFEQKTRTAEEQARQRELDRQQRDRREQRQREEFMMRMEQSDKKFLASLAAREAKATRAEKPTKAPTDVEKAVRGNATFLDQVEGIVDRAEKLAREGKIQGIGVIKGLVPYEAAQFYMSQEEKNLLQDFSALTNQKLKDQSGATVTGAEFARQRGVLPLRNDEIQTVIGKLKNWRRLVAEETAVIGKAYPGTIRQYGIVLDLPAEKTKMVPGMVYRTRQGNLLWNGAEFVEQEE